MSYLCRLTLVAAICLSSLPARAESEFKRLNREGEDLYEKGQYPEAAEKLLEAYERKPLPALLFNIARAYEKAGNDDQAIHFYQGYIDAEGTDPDTLTKAKVAIDAIKVRQADKQKAQEAAAEEQRIKDDAAEHDRVEAEKKLQAQAEQDRIARENAARQVAPEPKGPSRVPAIILLPVGAIGIGGGVVFGLMAKSASDSEAGTFDPVQRPQFRNTAKTDALIADVCYGVGAIATGVGLFFLLRSGSSSDDAASSSAATPVVDSRQASVLSRAVPSALVFDRGAGVAVGGAW